MFAEKNERFRVEEKVFNPSFLYSSTWRGVNWIEIRLCVLRNWELSGWSPAEITLPREPLLNSPPSHQEFESTRLCDCTPIVLPFSNSRPRDKVIRYVFWLLFLESCFKILLFISFDDPDWENCSINNSNAKHLRLNKSFLQTCQVVSVTEMQIPRDMYLKYFSTHMNLILSKKSATEVI